MSNPAGPRPDGRRPRGARPGGRPGGRRPVRVIPDELPPSEARRRRARWLTLAALALTLVAGLIGWTVWSRHQAAVNARPAGATDDGGPGAGVWLAGNGPIAVELYLDFNCPECQQVMAQINPMLDQMVSEGRIRLVLHPVAFLDGRSTPAGYSTRAAVAAGCASDEGKAKEYAQALLHRQPAAGQPGLSDDEFIELAGEVGLIAPSFAQCVRDQKYTNWVTNVDDQATRRGVNTAPVIIVGGDPVDPPTPDRVAAAITQAE